MKASIHPQYHTEATVACSCGNSFTTGSTKEDLRVEVCHKCHPLYTGEKRFVDVLGRVDRFQQKQKAASKIQESGKGKKKTDRSEYKPKSLRELLTEI